MPAASSGAPLRLELQSVEINDASEVVKSAAWSTVSDEVPIIECGALFAFKVSYGGAAGPAVYATLLAVDPDMTIHAVLPINLESAWSSNRCCSRAMFASAALPLHQPVWPSHGRLVCNQ